LELTVRASFGLASYPEDGTTKNDVLRAADEMMYLVKKSTRDGVGIAQRGCIPT
jgi:GGDEF domain-containing protein